MFSDKDLAEIKNHELTVDQINGQIAKIKSGMAFCKLKEAATVGNGILKLKEHEETYFINLLDQRSPELSMVKFVPASGAATRMFKFLFEFLNNYDLTQGSINSYIEKSNNKELTKFLEAIEKLPFFEEVVHKTHKVIPNFNDLSFEEERVEFVKTMLDEARLNYSFYPKGLLPFHKYKARVSTAFEEHFFEAAYYASSLNVANLHFTISEIHNKNFNEELNYIQEDIEAETNKTFNTSFSYQKKSTDTIALTLNDELYKDTDGSILFRPSGHGALLENLNDLKYDIIFIKNIDNVVVKEHHQNISNYKKMLAGILLEVQEKAFKFLNQLETENPNDINISEIKDFLTDKLNVVIGSDFEKNKASFQINYLMDKLNRPIRVCGMVKNEGEPGGGPFWVEDDKGNVSLQIVESAQVDTDDTNQVRILKESTHFNPVDIVCGVRNYQGLSYNLTEYVDYNAAFITLKNHAGTDIKALELPGLWNGSMANWNTLFVEVPLSTFNPVKTVNDLLRSAHQA